MSGAPITEINRDTFWALMAGGKAVCGLDLDAETKWLKGQLQQMEPKEALRFHHITLRYLDLAYQYGLWSAASILTQGCGDDGFTDFCCWLIAQGKDVYLAALKDPDSLADAKPYGGCRFADLNYLGDIVYEEKTGRSAYSETIPDGLRTELDALKAEVKYGPTAGYPMELDELEKYLPRLFARYIDPALLSSQIAQGGPVWNPICSEVQEARKKFKPQKNDAQEHTLKLYTALQVDVTEDGQRPMELPDPDTLMNQEERERRTAYHDAILTAITAAPFRKDTTGKFRYDLRNLDAFQRLGENVTSMVHTVEDVGGKIFGVTTCRLKAPLNQAELSLVQGYCLFLYGENIFRRELSCPASGAYGELSVYIGDGENCTILTEKEMKKDLRHKPQHQKKGGDAR